jgi:hypothetical protein
MQKEDEDMFKSLMNTLPTSLNEVIRDLAYDTPRANYSRVISSLKYNIPVCGVNCRYRIRLYGACNLNIAPLPLVRQTHAICDVDKCSHSVSLYEHSVCFQHANFLDFPQEYEYHHLNCNRNR